MKTKYRVSICKRKIKVEAEANDPIEAATLALEKLIKTGDDWAIGDIVSAEDLSTKEVYYMASSMILANNGLYDKAREISHYSELAMQQLRSI